MFMWLPSYVVKEFKFCLPTILNYIFEKIYIFVLDYEVS